MSQSDRRTHGALLIGAYALLVLLPLVAVGVAREETGHSLLYTIGKNLALSGFAIVALQFVLSARFRWLERPFGQDLVYDFHRAMGVLAFFLILSHPLLMAWGDGEWGMLYEVDVSWMIWLGRAALLLLILHVAVTAFRASLGIEYQLWRRWHNILALGVLLAAFVHSYARGGDFDLPFLSWYWPLLLSAGLGAWTWQSVVRPLRKKRRPWRVASVDRETRDVWTVAMEPPEGEEPYAHEPGQFHFLTFRRGRGLPEERHHWTISSSPEESRVRTSTIKESGDFTRTIGETRPGDEVLVHGPFGAFSHLRHPEEGDLVFVAGGIGITPLMSMLRSMRDRGDGRRILLAWANRTEADIVFREELGEMERGEASRLTTVHVLEEPPEGWTGEEGRFDPDRMERLFGPHLEERGFYVCGPPAMNDIVIGWLRERGVPDRRIHTERFEP